MNSEQLYKELQEKKFILSGPCVIEVPNLKTHYNNLRTEYFAMYHLYNFTEYTLRMLLINTGFKILKERQITGTSICFVCEKNPVVNNGNEYLKVIKKYYKIKYL